MKSNRGVGKERARRTGRGSMMQVTCSGYIRCLDTNFLTGEAKQVVVARRKADESVIQQYYSYLFVLIKFMCLPN